MNIRKSDCESKSSSLHPDSFICTASHNDKQQDPAGVTKPQPQNGKNTCERLHVLFNVLLQLSREFFKEEEERTIGFAKYNIFRSSSLLSRHIASILSK